MKKTTIIALLFAIFASTACGGMEQPVSDGGAEADSQSLEETSAQEEGYDYEGHDLGGQTITILNCEKSKWDMTCAITYDEFNGEVLNDAIYNRSMYVMNKLNFELDEINSSYDDLKTTLSNAVLAGDDTYDIAYQRLHETFAGITDGYFYCLNDLENLQLSQPYWDQEFLRTTSIGHKNYFASSSLHLMSLDGIWCLFFNKDMMDDYKLEYPYQLVRDGEWTLDKLAEYCKTAANLNSDDSFALPEAGGGTCVYGMTSFYSCIPKLIFGMDAVYVEKDSDDLPHFSAESEHFINAVEKLGSFLSTDGYYCAASDTETNPNFYYKIFQDQRAMFLGAELKTAQVLRNMEQSFGILPFPKYDAAQSGYRSMPLHIMCVATIPVTNNNPEDAALVLDALSYESDAQVLDVYYGVTVEQKGLRDEESIEMLEIIKESKSFDIAVAYSWCEELENEFRNNLPLGMTDISGKIAANKSKIEQKIADSIESITG